MDGLLTVEQTKLCRGYCKQVKPLGAFYIRNSGPQKGKAMTWCIECLRQKQRSPEFLEYARNRLRDWRARNPKKARAIGRRANLRAKYKKTPEDIEKMLIEQNNRCAACSEPFTTKSRNTMPVIHHDHVTGFVLDLLHHGCNCSEGLLGTAVKAERLAKYMRKNEPTLFSKRLEP